MHAPFILRDATVPACLVDAAGDGSLRRVDITIVEGRIAAMTPAGGTVSDTLEVLDLKGGLVLPAFVELHTHLDKGHIWPRQPNPDGTFMGALVAAAEDRGTRWTASDIETRMDFALRCAYAHGTAAIRTHLDSGGPNNDTAWSVFEAMRTRWAGRIELQAVALVGPDQMLDDAVIRPVAERAKAAGGSLGGAIGVHPQARDAMFKVVEVAGELGLDLDLHCDETLDPDAETLRHLADAVIETGFSGNVVAGHCCSLTVQQAEIAMATIARVAEAGIAIVSLPMCNMYLQDRHNEHLVRTPRYRGATLVNEMKAAGIRVALSSDNTRDPFYAYGDLDALEVLREGARIQQFDHPAADAWTWVRSVTADPAAIGGFGYTGTLQAGGPADLILFSARNWTELLSRPQADRIVLRGGVRIDTTLPDYRELDELMEL